MRKSRTYGSVRGAAGNRRPYREHGAAPHSITSSARASSDGGKYGAIGRGGVAAQFAGTKAAGISTPISR